MNTVQQVFFFFVKQSLLNGVKWEGYGCKTEQQSNRNNKENVDYFGGSVFIPYFSLRSFSCSSFFFVSIFWKALKKKKIITELKEFCTTIKVNINKAIVNPKMNSWTKVTAFIVWKRMFWTFCIIPPFVLPRRNTIINVWNRNAVNGRILLFG